MKIIHYIPSIDEEDGGVSSYIKALSSELGKYIELHIATHHTKNEIQLTNCQLHFLSKSYNAISEFKELLINIKPDAIQTNTCWRPIASFVVNIAKSLNIPVVYCSHGMLEPWILKRHHWTRKVPALLLYQKKALKNADILLATAESEKQNLLKLGYNNKVVVVPNCIDTNNISIRTNWGKMHVILFFSRIHEKKGINLLIEAAAKLKDKLLNYKIVIIGDGSPSYCNRLKKLSEKYKVNNIIHFMGGVYGKKKWEILKAADVLILPTYSENFGICIAEALACGTPVITTKGAPWQDLETYDCGWWTEIGTDAIAEALVSFLNCSDEKLKAMGTNGRALIERKYSSEIVAQMMIKLYEDAIYLKNKGLNSI